jgi:hypothetical protein
LKKFVKRQQSRSECCDFTKKFEFNKKFLKTFKTFFNFAPHGARVRGCVFKMKFRVLSREFESIETSPGFAQLLGENWN